MRAVIIVLPWVLSALACEAQVRPSAPARHDTGKQAMYGDAALVPTREGERVRRELALAGEITTALALLGFDAAHVDIELGPEPSALVVIRSAEHTPLEREAVVELTRAIVPELDADDVHVVTREVVDTEPTPAPAGPPPWPLALACLGLGLSLGVGGERLRMRRR